MTQKKDDKPDLHLLDAGEMVKIEDIVAMYTSMTGRDPSPEEIEEARKILES